MDWNNVSNPTQLGNHIMKMKSVPFFQLCFYSIIAGFSLNHLLTSETAGAKPGTHSRAYREYKTVFDEVQLHLSEDEYLTACPRPDLVLSCGNNRCEPEKGENEITCPADCLNVPVHTYNSQTFCKDVKEVFKPRTPQEVQAIVQDAWKKKTPVRVIGRAHSTSSILCNEGILISTENLDHIQGIEVFEGKETVLTEPGVSEYELAQYLHKHRRSLGYGLAGYRELVWVDS
jgi:hypothetical protein